jgi:integrase
MPRTNKIWWRKERNEWFVKIDGKLHRLGPDKEEAERQFHELMSKPKEKLNPEMVVVVLDRFLAWNDKNRKGRTQEWYVRHLQSFTSHIGTITVSKIKTHHVQSWIDSLQVSDSTKNGAWRAVNRAFNWAVKQELMTKNPARDVEKPAMTAREDFVTEAEYEIVMAKVKDSFRDLLTVAWQCGPRPQELFTVEARHVELEKCRWHFPPKEGKQGRRRFVYLTPDAVEITKRLMEQHPTGALFRNSKGRPWDKGSVKCRFSRLKTKVGRQLCLYLWRHSWITRKLIAGVDSHIVAQLSGHRDTRMLDAVYSHAVENWEAMADAAGKEARPSLAGQ